MEKKEKQKFKNQIIFDVILIFIFSALSYYLFLQYDDLNNKISDANSLYSSYLELKTNGISVSDLPKVSAKYGSNKDIADAFTDKERLRGIITKTSGKEDYLTWLGSELEKEQKYNDEAKQNQDIIGNILPIFYQYTDGFSDDKAKSIDHQITLDNFTSFVETNILKQNDISSYSPIGIDNITFGDGGTKKIKTTNSNSPNLIGSFVLNLDFQGKNSSISKMLEYIQNSGKLDIQNGKLVKESKTNNVSNYSSLNNLLMSIDSLTLKSPLLDKDIIGADGKVVMNGGTIIIRFYVRGIGYEQLSKIKTDSIKNLNDLFTDVSNKSKYCDAGNNPLCKDGAGSEAVANLRSLLKDISALKSKVDLKSKVIIKQDLDVNQELSDWLDISSSIDNLKYSSAKSINYINNFTKKGAK